MLGLKRVDFWILLPAAFLAFLGTIVLSSIFPSEFPVRFIHLFLALVVFFVFASIDIRILRVFAPFLYLFSIFLLGATFLLGTLTRGSVRWISFGPLTIQASEVVKPTLIVFLSWVVERGDGRFLKAVLFSLPVLFLILIQPDLGSGIVLLSAVLGVIFMNGAGLRLFLGLAALFFAISPLLWKFLVDYQKERLVTFLNPSLDPLGAGYNLLQSVIAVGGGGVWGKGLGQGTQSQLLFLPERHTDFIFAALAEELGFLGGLALILCFTIILVRVLIKASQSKDTFEGAILGGIFSVIFVQAAINIGMNMGILPITGVPLPFVSSGGSSMVAMSALLGIASGIGKR